jgi:hypothetical protein
VTLEKPWSERLAAGLGKARAALAVCTWLEGEMHWLPIHDVIIKSIIK